MRHIYLFIALFFLCPFSNAQENLGFEEWSDGNPDSWDFFFLFNEPFHLNDAIRATGGTYSELPVQEAESAKEGNKALKLVSISLTDSDEDGEYAGFVGQIFEIDKAVAEVRFYYRSNVPEGDTAAASITIYDDDGEFDLEGKNMLAYGGVFITGVQDEWTEVTMPLEKIKDGVPMTAAINFASSNDLMNAGVFVGEITVGSTFEVDDVRIFYDNTTESKNAISENLIKVYPNPTTEFLNIELKEIPDAVFMLYANDGTLILNQNLVMGTNNIALDSPSSGIYFYKIKTVDDEIIKADKILIE